MSFYGSHIHAELLSAVAWRYSLHYRVSCKYRCSHVQNAQESLKHLRWTLLNIFLLSDKHVCDCSQFFKWSFPWRKMDLLCRGMNRNATIWSHNEVILHHCVNQVMLTYMLKMMSTSLSVILVNSFRDEVGGFRARPELICSTLNQEFLFNHKQLFILTTLSVFNFDP